MKEKAKSKLKKLWYNLKRPAFLIPFAITWVLLESPAIFGAIMYWATGDNYWWAVAGGWIALTAPTLPIPVIPICIAVAFGVEKIIDRRKRK